MADPGEEFERILADARAQLGRIRLELPQLEEGTPGPRDIEAWAKSSLGPAPAAPAPVVVAEPAPPVMAAPAPVFAAPPLRPSLAPPPPEPAPEDAPPAPAPATPRARETPPPARPREAEPARPALAPGRKALWGAAAAVAAAALLWTALRPGGGTVELPFTDFDALAVDDAGGVIAARGLILERRGPDGSTARLAALERPLRSLSWTPEGLYAVDGSPALLRWGAPDAPPDRFTLDHAPRHVFAGPDGVWTQDASGQVRQFLLNRSMTGVFLQPLDMAVLPGGPTGAFAVASDGAVLTVDAQGALRRYEHAVGAYASPSRGADYGAGAVLVPAPSGARVLRLRADGVRVLTRL